MSRPARWGQERRLEFIDFRLYWEGRVNRSDLISFFGVSVPQASLDLAKYQQLAPNNIAYDRTRKAYIAKPEFSPVVASKEADAYLDQLLGFELGMLYRNMSFVGWNIPVAAVRDPTRRVDASVLRVVLHAIRSRQTVAINYQSMMRPIPTERVISPHAIAFDGSRWHVRAFCHERQSFRDFVFARILATRLGDASAIDSSSDNVWHREVKIVVIANPALTPAQQRAVELDYGMTDGRLVLTTREALLFYTFRMLGVLPQLKTITEYVVLENRDQLNSFLVSQGLSADQSGD